MGKREQSVVVGVFESSGPAELAIDELRHAGFHDNQIGLATPAGEITKAETSIDQREAKAADGATVGAVAGGAVGVVVGALATTVFPPSGIVIAGTYLGGILAGVVGGAAAGAAFGGYFGPFVAMGLSKDEARRYESDIQAGRTIVVVKPEERLEEAEGILHDHGARCSIDVWW